MSDKMRWRYGDTNPVVAAVDSATVIEIGDLLWQDVDDAKPASVQDISIDRKIVPREEEHRQRQGHFARNFLGVAMQRSRSGGTEPVRVAITGVFEFDVKNDGTTYELGELIGVTSISYPGHFDRAAGAETLELLNQRVAKVYDPWFGIGRVAERAPMAVKSVMVSIRSKVMEISL